ncbi:MAG TPA: hypothetical protein VN812_14300 [Candidatus Acidoferrales bacterium]|nr:hypothetical protein [Candidatus Acidoferrales bacterium]
MRFGKGVWPGAVASTLFGESAFPVCSPVYLGRRKPRLSVERPAESRLLAVKVTCQPWFD